ncbi:unnamed protein product [Acanthoscelides obtectus]|uniref:Uncharacterized protein n=1 Tax=Acanthoscelides obtectus TaxID=200917 RepID=A0A9P0KD15_ACAOB|nr:unnamed protein product [Acanthoscelides obtectus]CAK1640986.1 hypothetical protein AOBTE_LOCUS12059 [Acanthoscelides obtectus]
MADVFHAISLHRRYSILPFLDGNVREFSDTCPSNEFLFGKTFPDQWKSASEAQRLGFSIKKKEKALGTASSKPVIYKKLEPKPGSSRVSSSLNSRRQQHKSRIKNEEERFRSAISYRKHYSTGDPATSAAYRAGVYIEMIRERAGWTQKSEIFAKFYNRPLCSDVTAFAKGILSLT